MGDLAAELLTPRRQGSGIGTGLLSHVEKIVRAHRLMVTF
jgi:hypothetical protein